MAQVFVFRDEGFQKGTAGKTIVFTTSHSYCRSAASGSPQHGLPDPRQG
jgi:hypothetical protein